MGGLPQDAKAWSSDKNRLHQCRLHGRRDAGRLILARRSNTRCTFISPLRLLMAQTRDV